MNLNSTFESIRIIKEIIQGKLRIIAFGIIHIKGIR